MFFKWTLGTKRLRLMKDTAYKCLKAYRNFKQDSTLLNATQNLGSEFTFGIFKLMHNNSSKP